MTPDLRTAAAIVAIIVLPIFAWVVYYKYQAYFATCDPGTVEVLGWTDGGQRVRLCVPNPAPVAP